MRSHPLLALATLLILGSVATAAGHLGSSTKNLTYRTTTAASPASDAGAPRASPVVRHLVRLETAPVPLGPVSWTPRFVVIVAAVHRTSARHVASAHQDAGGVWAELRLCESGGNYSMDSGNGYYGAYQFSASTWWAIGFRGLPDEAAPAVQDEAALRLRERSGWRAWPVCASRLGLAE